ncbi:hypothetical protein PVIIG_04341 [Plasmodium vivax India VII]|uniref:Uncharacterized protein n=6 Tax=Plasmodium vivax TaxID=5855 RepID=A5K4B9_PLAVS|nr:hypothetical protein, conserved [Plasmodium vivax]KMZ80556.1 hypothetical protein PVIIG_04341 [Plasmodium vivax India VII]KMZ84138.1 hypothetical protein PVBG_02365 [Plasmodium vivax Brazil I]KMZ91942.1 hypothetical protein PVMG_04501 [Plasmodium vivax Mauritania I]KMZ99790.1 hypothetical protein PVNG_04080 [Plasmodium vivax North Korean]EDL45497.1 hypothetical protein, conserved [Plasmodium vivax]|eukprot:XP_001615224.1 hypothetical protein [Plasmodium vivax Sal-1]
MEEDEKGGMWWENMYNNCAKKINQAGSKTVSLPASEEKPEGKKNENIKYSIFVKKSDTSINSGGDKCVSPNGDDHPSTRESAFEKEKKTEGGGNNPNGGETDGQIKPSGADPNWKVKTGNALISKVAIISKVTNRSKKKKKKKWKKRNEWGKCSAKWKAPAGCTSAQG